MKRGLTSFIVIIPIIIIALTLVAYMTIIEKEKIEIQTKYLQAIKQEQIDNSIKKSFKELLIYYNTNSVEKSIPCEDEPIPDEPISFPGKVTRAAAKISGFLGQDNLVYLFNSNDLSWAEYITTHYAKQGISVKFDMRTKQSPIGLPLEPIIPIPYRDYKGITKLLITCNPETKKLNNALNGQLSTIYPEFNSTILHYTIEDSTTHLTWNRDIANNIVPK